MKAGIRRTWVLVLIQFHGFDGDDGEFVSVGVGCDRVSSMRVVVNVVGVGERRR